MRPDLVVVVIKRTVTPVAFLHAEENHSAAVLKKRVCTPPKLVGPLEIENAQTGAFRVEHTGSTVGVHETRRPAASEPEAVLRRSRPPGSGKQKRTESAPAEHG